MSRRQLTVALALRANMAGGFFGHPQGGFGRHLPSDGLSFVEKKLSFFRGKSSFFHALSNKTQEKLNKNSTLPPKC